MTVRLARFVMPALLVLPVPFALAQQPAAPAAPSAPSAPPPPPARGQRGPGGNGGPRGEMRAQGGQGGGRDFGGRERGFERGGEMRGGEMRGGEMGGRRGGFGGGREHGGMMMAGFHMPPGAWWKNTELVTRVGLSPDQVKKLDDLSLESKLDAVRMHATIEEDQLRLEPLMSGSAFDAARTQVALDKIADERAALEKAEAKSMVGMRAVLTPDQWTKLKAEHGGGRFGGPEMGPGGPHPGGNGPGGGRRGGPAPTE